MLDNRIKELEKELEDIESKAIYESLLPKIHRYGFLTGFTSFYREGQVIIFDGDPNHKWDKVKLSKVEEKLAALEKAVEIACPKKCVKKK